MDVSSSGEAQPANGQSVFFAYDLPAFAAGDAAAGSSLCVRAEVAPLSAFTFPDERGSCVPQICNYSRGGRRAGKAPSLLDVWGHQRFSHLFDVQPLLVRFPIRLPRRVECPQDVGVIE